MFKDLIPRRKKEIGPPLVSFRQNLDRLFDDFFTGFQVPELWQSSFPGEDFMPRINVAETEKEFQVTAELPGIVEKDVSITLENNVLTIKGEKKQEEEKKDKDYHRVERRYGSFYRSFSVPEHVDETKIEAKFGNGILTVVLPKKTPTAKSKKIEIKTE